jgi:hypothetical protein
MFLVIICQFLLTFTSQELNPTSHSCKGWLDQVDICIIDVETYLHGSSLIFVKNYPMDRSNYDKVRVFPLNVHLKLNSLFC